MSEGLAIQVDHAWKRYSDSWVLKGLDMAVQEGTIYALLGPSGCGKSTLLNCIVGQMDLDSGAIAVKCERRNLLGYMPQSIALYLTMTIGETFTYYGRMGNMSSMQIKERREKLVTLLELPPLDRVVDTLSGGQQRRMSLTVALINDPTLLLLDEPTVGLDPVLSHSIWDHLVKMAKEEKKTIIITTHYIEEARQANTVGLMRGGVLLCEETPEILMKTNNCDTMEQVFLKLSRKQEDVISTNNNNYQLPTSEERVQITDTRHQLQRDTIFSLPYFRAEVTKNVIFIWRNKPMLLLLVALPLIVSYLFHFCLGVTPRGVHLAIINNEVDSLSTCFDQKYVGCNFSQPISCRVLKELVKLNYELIEFKSYSEGVEAVQQRPDLWGVIQIPDNYSENLVERFTLNLNTPPEVVDRGEMSVWLDNSNYFIGKFIEIFINQAFFAGIGSFFKDCGWPVQTFDIPIDFQEPIFGAAKPDMRHYVSPPIMILIVFYLPMSYTIGVIFQEKVNGVLERSMIAGLRMSEVLMGHVTVQLVILIVQCLVCIITVYWWHGHPYLGSLFWGTLLLLLQGISGLGFGFLIAISTSDVITGTFLSIGTLITYFFLSGSMWPQEGLYPALQFFRPVIPIAYSVEAYRGITVRAWSITHPIVFHGFLSVGGWSLFFIASAFLVEHIKGYFNKK